MSAPAGAAMPQGRGLKQPTGDSPSVAPARSEGGAATGSEDIAPAQAGAEHKQPRLTPADLHRAVTGERALILAHITGKIRACRKAGEPAADSLTRLTVLHEEIAAGLHVPDHQEQPKA